MAKTAKTVAPMKIKGWPDDELMALYMAHNSGAKNVPSYADGRRLRYDGANLYEDGNDLVLRCVVKGKHRFILATNEGWRGGGWGSRTHKVVNAARYLTTDKTGPVLKTSLHGRPFPNDIDAGALRCMIEKGADTDVVTYLAKVYRVPLSAIYRVTAPTHTGYRGNPVERATGYMEWHAPAARAKRAKEKREYKAEQERRLRPYTDAVRNAAWALDDLTRDDAAITSSDILAFVGYTPQPGDMFKFLLPGFQSNNGPWPQVGVWTEDRQMVRVCHRGWHLTNATGLAQWLSWGSELYLAEGTGECSPSNGPQADGKQAFQRARLLRQIGGGITVQAIRAWKRYQSGDLRRDQIAAAEAALDDARYMLAMAEQGYI